MISKTIRIKSPGPAENMYWDNLEISSPSAGRPEHDIEHCWLIHSTSSQLLIFICRWGLKNCASTWPATTAASSG